MSHARLDFARLNDRKTTRHHVRIDCQVVRESDFRLVGHRTLDLSTDGMLVRTTQDVTVGEPVLVCFQATQLGLWFDLQGEITRLIEGRRPEDEGRALGVRFTEIHPLSRLILRGHLRRVPPVVPQRPTRVDYASAVREIAVA